MPKITSEAPQRNVLNHTVHPSAPSSTTAVEQANVADQKPFVVAVPMASADLEDQIYENDVKAVKQWWTDPRWRYTKRPFTAEQIVAKRGNLKIEYPSNAMSKKLWNIVEGRFKVRSSFGRSASIGADL